MDTVNVVLNTSADEHTIDKAVIIDDKRSVYASDPESAAELGPGLRDELIASHEMALSDSRESADTQDAGIAQDDSAWYGENGDQCYTSQRNLKDLSEESFQTPCAQESSEWLERFNGKLERVPSHENILIITSTEDLEEFLQFYYCCMPGMTDDVFPYLHGLNTIKQRIFFKATSQLNDLMRFGPLAVPDSISKLFEVIFVDSASSTQKLINLCELSDFLHSKKKNPGYDLEMSSSPKYERLDFVNCLKESSDEISNRNFQLQLDLMSAISNFLVYNDSMNFNENLNVALLLDLLSDSKLIYVVDISPEGFQRVNPVFLEPLNKPCLANICQDSMWLLHSMKMPFENVYTGTIQDFKRLNMGKQDFRLIINCSEKFTFPTLSFLHDCISGKKRDTIIYLTFPSSGAFDITRITHEQALSLLNVLKLIHRYTRVFNENAFIFSYDGYTGLSFLVIALACLWRTKGDFRPLEEVILELLGHDSDIRLYFFQGDLVFLKRFEKFILWLSSFKLNDDVLLTSLDYGQINQTYNAWVCSYPRKVYDWFDYAKDNNFPSRILSNLYLGTLFHASSSTILLSTNIERIVSLGERPAWLMYLPVVFEDEMKYSSGVKKVIAPIYRLNNGNYSIYYLKDLKISLEFTLKEFIYVHGLKDDGRDSILELLIDAPESVCSLLLHQCKSENPNTLIHCRIGVSRSATFVIALLMKYKRMTLNEAFVFVHVRRLNTLIQPNLKLFYDLYFFNEYLFKDKSYNCWWELCKQIRSLNTYYLT